MAVFRERAAKYGEFEVAKPFLQNLYGNFVHVNIFNNQKYTYRLSLTAEEQWKFVNTTGQSTVLIPHRNQVPKHEKGLARYKHLDLLDLKPLSFLKTFKNPCWYDENKILRCLPYFYLIGAPKCGTTDLHSRIEAHEDYVSARRKEPHWLTRERERNMSMFRFIDYLGFFAKLSERLNNAKLEKDLPRNLITGDCSASTMWDNSEWPNLPRNNNPLEPQFTNADYIYHLNPNTKIIFILRNPVARLYSDYLYFRKDKRKSPANFHKKVVDSIHIFTACLKHTSLRSCVYNKDIGEHLQVRLHVGIYFVYLTEWYRRFPSSQILPLSLEEYSKTLNASLTKIFDFLDMRMSSNFHKIVSMRRANTRSDRNINVGPMWPETAQLLHKFYKPFNVLLAELLQNEKFNYGPG